MKKILILFSCFVLFIPAMSEAQIDSVYYHDSQFESQWGSSTGNDLFRLYVRVTPNTYPATLKGIRCWFRNAPAGATFKWTVYTDAAGAANGGVTNVYMSANA